MRLIYGRGLPTSRENDDRRETLARSYRGDVAALVDELSQADLVEIFRQLTFEVDGHECYLSNPGKYRRDELRAFAAKAFAGQDVEVPAPFERAEPTPDESGEISGEPDGDDDQDGTDDDGERPFKTVTTDWSRPRKIARVMRRLGWRVPERLRTERFQQLIVELRGLGIELCLAGDRQAIALDESAESPGIAARIRLRRKDVPSSSPNEETSEEDVDLSDAQPLLADEKVARLGLKRDPCFLYFIKDGAIWAVARGEASQNRVRAKKIALVNVQLDHDRYVYYVDSDGDLARREKRPSSSSSANGINADPTLSLLGWAVIHSDGVVDPREVAELRRALSDSGQQYNGTYDVSSLEAAITVACTAPIAVKEHLVRRLFNIATADGLLAEEEVKLLKMVEQRLLPGSELLSGMIADWRTANEMAEANRGDQLIEEILSILTSSTQWQQ